MVPFHNCSFPRCFNWLSLNFSLQQFFTRDTIYDSYTFKEGMFNFQIWFWLSAVQKSRQEFWLALLRYFERCNTSSLQWGSKTNFTESEIMSLNWKTESFPLFPFSSEPVCATGNEKKSWDVTSVWQSSVQKWAVFTSCLTLPLSAQHWYCSSRTATINLAIPSQPWSS